MVSMALESGKSAGVDYRCTTPVMKGGANSLMKTPFHFRCKAELLISIALGCILIAALSGCYPETKMPFEFPNTKWVCDELNAWFIVDPVHDAVYYGQMMIDGKMQEVGFVTGPGSSGNIFEFSLVNTNSKLSEPKPRYWMGKVSYREDKFVLIESKENHVFDEECFPITFVREELDEETIRKISPWDSNGILKEPSLFDAHEFSNEAASVLEESLSDIKTPCQLGLFDLDEDGIPEVMVLNHIGWSATCEFFNLTDPAPAESSLLSGWSEIGVENVYVQRSNASIKWRIEGDSSHGFADTTRNDIIELEDGKTTVIGCEFTYTLNDERVPSSLFVHTMVDGEEAETLNLDLCDPSSEPIEEFLSGSLYQHYVQQNWEKLDEPPWALEEPVSPGSKDLQTRIWELYRKWSSQ